MVVAKFLVSSEQAFDGEFAIFVPCVVYSLNSVVVTVVCVLLAYFQVIQKLLNFFLASTKQWKIMTQYLGTNKILKSLSDTRLFARSNAINALQNDHFFIG